MGKITPRQQLSLMLTLFVLLFSKLSHAVSPVLFSAEYKGKYSGMTITSVRTLTHQTDNRYSFKSDIKNFFGYITEESLFTRESDSRILPNIYRYKRKILGKKTSQSITFDWSTKTANFIREDRPEKNKAHRVEQGILDLSLYQLQLQRDLFNGKSVYEYVIVKPNKIKFIEFANQENESISVGGKRYDAIRLQKINRDDDKQTLIWVVPELEYQIARIQHTDEEGDSYSIELTSFRASTEALRAFYKNDSPTTTIKIEPAHQKESQSPN